MKRNDNYRYYSQEDVDNIIANCEQRIKSNTVADIFLGFCLGFPVWTILVWLTL